MHLTRNDWFPPKEDIQTFLKPLPFPFRLISFSICVHVDFMGSILRVVFTLLVLLELSSPELFLQCFWSLTGFPPSNTANCAWLKEAATASHSETCTDKCSRLLLPTWLLYITKLPAIKMEPATLNIITNSLEYQVANFRLLLTLWVCWDHLVVPHCFLDFATDTSSCTCLLLSTLLVPAKEYQRDRLGGF